MEKDLDGNIFLEPKQLILNFEAVSANHRMYGANKVSARYLYKKERDLLEKEVSKQIGEYRASGRKSLKISRFWGKRKRSFDEANLIGGFKILIDSLVRAGFLEDDNVDLFKGYYFQEKSTTGEPYIKIEVLDPFNELVTALGKISEQMEVKEPTLIKAAIEAGLIN